MAVVFALARLYRVSNELLQKFPAEFTTPLQISWVTPQDLLKGFS
jgi:hypothetical protein